MRTGARGFNLLEVVVAMALFLTAIMVIVNLFPISSRAIEQSRWRTQALQIAQMQMEMYLAGLSKPSGTFPDPSPTTVPITVGDATQALTFDPTITVTPGSAAGLYNVRVLVSYSYLTPSNTSRLEFVQLETVAVVPP